MTTMTISLPSRLAAAVEAEVANGNYADASEVIVAALLALDAREGAIANQFRDHIIAANASFLANPDDVCTSDEILARIDARHGVAVPAE